jgi:hypothetical protein
MILKSSIAPTKAQLNQTAAILINIKKAWVA